MFLKLSPRSRGLESYQLTKARSATSVSGFSFLNFLSNKENGPMSLRVEPVAGVRNYFYEREPEEREERLRDGRKKKTRCIRRPPVKNQKR
jgi:hypothetical protein